MTSLTNTGTLPRASTVLSRSFSALSQFVRNMAKNPISLISMIIVLLYIALAVVGPSIAPYDFDENLRGDDRRLLRDQPPSTEFLMGTDNSGRDILSRILWGARDTIGLPLFATSFAVLLGTAIGLSTGYIGGWYDEIILRFMDSLLAIPALVLALVILTIVPEDAVNVGLVIVIALLYAPIVTRVVRSSVLNVRDRGYIEAAKLRGESSFYIMTREILPSVLPALIVEASLRFSYAIFLVASLGFLGLGVQPPSPEWGRMVLIARDAPGNPYMLWFPVFMISVLIISINLMSDGLRRVFRNEEARE